MSVSVSFKESKKNRLNIFCICVHTMYLLTKAVFTLGLDYDRIIIELNLEWVHINLLKSLIIIGL